MAEIGDGGIVLLPGEGRTVDLAGATVRTLHETDAEADGSFALVETVESAEGFGPPLHVHRDAAESFYVIEGEYLMHIDGRDFTCPAGSFVHVPRGMPHTFKGALGSRKLNLYTPSAMVGYFEELAAALKGGVDEDGLAEIAERYSMTVLGHAPEGYL
jgi:mannose-6-phosphate isomerase-like protein (cupin superfamily)